MFFCVSVQVANSCKLEGLGEWTGNVCRISSPRVECSQTRSTNVLPVSAVLIYCSLYNFATGSSSSSASNDNVMAKSDLEIVRNVTDMVLNLSGGTGEDTTNLEA
jgi:hypothetical protein